MLEYKFYVVVLNHFCDSWLKIDGLFYFVKSVNTKVTSSESIIILTRPSLVLTCSILFYDFAKQKEPKVFRECQKFFYDQLANFGC